MENEEGYSDAASVYRTPLESAIDNMATHLNSISNITQMPIIRESRGIYPDYNTLTNIPSNLLVDDNIGDEDFVIDTETAPIYQTIQQVVEHTIEDVIEVDVNEILNNFNGDLEDAPIVEESVEVEEPFSISEEDLGIVEALVNEIQLIPVNSGTILVSETTSRFSSAEWYAQIQRENVLLAGVGGIGSYIVFLLSRLNIQGMLLYDDDRVDTVNLAGQLFSLKDVGKFKTDALTSMVGNYSNFHKVVSMRDKFVAGSPPMKVMICGFDNMLARTNYFHSWKNLVDNLPYEEKAECLFIDGRLAAEEYQILCMRGDDNYSINRYKNEYLFTDAEADVTLCSYKQTTFMANQIASQMVNLFVNFVANKCEPIIDRYLPFYIEYNAETMFFKTTS